MKTTLWMALSAVVVMFAACQKENDDTEETPTTTEDFQPLSAGSTWQYNSSSSGAFTEVVTGTDTTIDGQKYFAIDNSADGRRYINKNNGTYTSLGRVSQLDTTLKLIYLKDAAAGTSWNNTGSYSGIPVTLTYTIVSRDGSMTVNNISYSDVITLNFSVGAADPFSGQTISIASGRQYYAKKIGAIASSIQYKVGTVQGTDSTYLVSSNIK